MATALWLGDGTDPAPNCPSVLDDADTADWLLWDAMQGRTDSDALAETGVYRVLWATPAAGLDVQTRRNAVAGNANDLWLAWQVEDPFGVINNSTDTYNAYLSGWFTIRFLVETD